VVTAFQRPSDGDLWNCTPWCIQERPTNLTPTIQQHSLIFAEIVLYELLTDAALQPLEADRDAPANHSTSSGTIIWMALSSGSRES